MINHLINPQFRSAIPANPSKKADVEIGGVYCGEDIGDGLLREEITERRFVIRKRVDANYALRIGEVCGGTQYGGGTCFQATRNSGEHVATRRTFAEAVKTLIPA